MRFSINKIANKLGHIIFYLLFSLLIIVMGFSFNSIDVDLWARLMNGAHILKYGTPAFCDIVSYTKTNVWIDPEWITSAFLYFISTKFGIYGLTILKILSVLIFFYTLVTCTRKLYLKEFKYNFGYFLILLIIFVQAGYLTYTTRCQIVTFILFTVWIYFLEKIRQGNDRFLYFMPVLMLLWLNTHGGCIAGVGILLFYAVGEALNRKPFKKYLYLLLVLVPVFMINPWGIDYLKFMFHSAFLDRSWISEWVSPIYLFPLKKLYFVFYVIAIIFSYFYYIFKSKLKYNNIDKVRLIILLLMNYLAFRHVKHIGLALIAYTLLFYDVFYFTYNSLMGKLRNYLEISQFAVSKLIKIKKAFLVTVIIVSSFIYSVIYPYDKIYLKRFQLMYPYIEMEFLKANNIKGKILSQFDYGSFIAYNYNPEYKIYIDGRQEQVYDSDVLDELMFFIFNHGPNPDLILEKYKPDIILLNDQLTKKNLNKISEYTKIYSNRGYNIFVLNKYKKNKYIYPKVDIREYIDNSLAKGFKYKEKMKK